MRGGFLKLILTHLFSTKYNEICWGDIIPNNNHKPPKGVPRCIVASFFLLKKFLKEKKKKK